MQKLKYFGCAVFAMSVIWWGAYALTHFNGWTAFPLTISGAVALIAIAVFLAESADSDRS